MWISSASVRRGELLLLGLFLVGCTSAQHVGKPGLPQKQGGASYYAEKYVGRATANGEIFDQEALTAAHRSLPFGTRVRVTRVDLVERPSVVVRINDRGPFKRGRIIDLSKHAARRLRMIRDGIAEVRLEVVSYPADVQAAAADSVVSDSVAADSVAADSVAADSVAADSVAADSLGSDAPSAGW